MMPASYLITLTGKEDGVEILIAVWNTAGVGTALYTEGNENGYKTLWIVPKGKKSREEVELLLSSVPQISSVSVIAVSNPVAENELVQVRSLFYDFGWDAVNVTNDDLALYVNAALQQRYNYYIDFDHRMRTEGLVQIQVKRPEEEPDFSDDRLKETLIEEEDENKVYTIDDFQCEEFVDTTEADLEHIVNLEIRGSIPKPPEDPDKNEND